MELTVTVRRAVPADVPQLVDLFNAQFADHDIDVGVAGVEHATRGLVSDAGRGFVLVAEHHRRIVGVAAVSLIWTLEHGGSSAWLDELFVVPAMRGRGIGTLLTSQVLDACRDAGCAAVDLEVERGHEEVERIYARLGFRAHERRRWVRSLAPDAAG